MHFGRLSKTDADLDAMCDLIFARTGRRPTREGFRGYRASTERVRAAITRWREREGIGASAIEVKEEPDPPVEVRDEIQARIAAMADQKRREAHVAWEMWKRAHPYEIPVARTRGQR